MRILQIAPPWFTVPPHGYGGIEQVVAQLTDGLVDAGHEVTLLASGGSTSRATVRSVFDVPPSSALGSTCHELIHVVAGYQARDEFDVIHDHAGFTGAAMGALLDGPPVVHTLHGPVAQHGLQKAIADYDLGHGAPFAAYARAKVRGEMMRWFRDERYAVHVPRPLHERHMQVRRVAAQLEVVLCRKPDVDEVAAHLGCSVAEVVEARTVDAAERSRTNQFPAQLGAEALDPPDPDLAAALQHLDQRARLLLYRRFWEGVSQREVGDELGVTQAHVSRLQRQALHQLAELLDPRRAAGVGPHRPGQ